MDVTEKIIKFDSYEGLLDAISKDVTSKDFLAQRYGVRFIMLNNFETFQNLAKHLQEMGVEMIGLESILDADDADSWITTDMLKRRIFSCKKPSLITPFSELVRFYPEEQFRGFFSEIILSEESKGNRIYIPIIGLQNRFTDFLSHFGRLQESAPIWQYLSEPQSVEVYLVRKYNDIKLPTTSKRCHLSSLREWLRFWKDQAPQEKIICSSLPINVNSSYAKPDNIFKFTPIYNAYEYIEKFLDLTIPIDYSDEDNDYWDALLENLIAVGFNNFNFDKYIRDRFNKLHFSISEAFREWAKSSLTAFDRWLLKHYILLQPELSGFPYFSLCINECNDLTTPNKLYVTYNERLFYCEPLEMNKFKGERTKWMSSFKNEFNSLVPQFSQSWVRDHILEIAKDSTELAVELCTGTFEYEKPFLLGAYAQHMDDDLILKKLYNNYPDLVRYMMNTIPLKFPENHQWAYNYICNYKKAKLVDELTEEIKSTIAAKNASRDSFYGWYYTFNNTKDVLLEINANKNLKPDKVYWLDGLGVEYYALITGLFEALDPNLRVVYSEITRSNLPSSTKLNGFYEPEVHKFGGIDEIGHDKGQYQQYQTLVREIDMIHDYVQQIITENQHQLTTFAIVSDHGMSALSRKAESRKLQGKYEHEGRYILSSEGKTGNDDFFFEHENETDGQKYRIALTHSSLAVKPTHEVHGGATPEELLVPFIIVSNKQNAQPLSHTINVIDEKVALSDSVISLRIMPEPASVKLRLEGKEYDMQRTGTKWSVKVDNAQAGLNRMIVIPEDGVPQNVDVEFYGLGPGNINDIFDL